MIQLIYLFKNRFKINQLLVKQFRVVIIELINKIVKWVNSVQSRVMQIDQKIIYLLNELCRLT